MLKPENTIILFDHSIRQLDHLIEIKTKRGDLRCGKVEILSGLISEALRRELAHQENTK